MKNKFLKLLIILVLFVFQTMGANAFSFRNMTLDFIDISDTHITTRIDTPYKALGSSHELLKDAIEQINDIEGLDFVMFTGDMVDFASEQNYTDYFTLLTKLKYPSLTAFGNHDSSPNGLSKEEALEIIKKYNPNYIFDKTYYAFSPKTDYRIIILDASKESDTTSNGELSLEQLEFLDNELSNNQDKVILIAMHFPSVEPFKAQEHNLINAKEFNEILLKYKNPIIVISGHYHASKIRKIGNLVFVSTPAMVTYPMAFRHIKITNYKDRVNYNFEFIETRLKDVQEANRQNVISYATLMGREKDKNINFTFRKKHPKSVRYKRNKIENSAKESIASKREIKKLSEPEDLKPKKERKFFNFKHKEATQDLNTEENTIETKKERKFFNFKHKENKENIEQSPEKLEI